jgi:hypothetical protein
MPGDYSTHAGELEGGGAVKNSFLPFRGVRSPQPAKPAQELSFERFIKSQAHKHGHTHAAAAAGAHKKTV